MKVWIVEWVGWPDEWGIEGVFASEDAAKEYAASKGECRESDREASYVDDSGATWGVTPYDVVGAPDDSALFDVAPSLPIPGATYEVKGTFTTFHSGKAKRVGAEDLRNPQRRDAGDEHKGG